MLQKYSDKEKCNSPLNSVIKMKATTMMMTKTRQDNTEGEREGISLEINIGYILVDKKKCIL